MAIVATTCWYDWAIWTAQGGSLGGRLKASRSLMIQEHVSCLPMLKSLAVDPGFNSRPWLPIPHNLATQSCKLSRVAQSAFSAVLDSGTDYLSSQMFIIAVTCASFALTQPPYTSLSHLYLDSAKTNQSERLSS
jgi:hypothetical protein